MRHLDPTLIATATQQHGMLTTRQLKLAGFDSKDLWSLVQRKTLLHPARGLYAVRELSHPEDDRGWHRQLVAGGFLLYPDALLTGTSALLSHDIDVWGASLTTPEFVRPCHRGGGIQPIRVRRASSRPAPVESAWGPTVPVADAVVQLAIDAGIVPGVVSADCALRLGKTSETELEDAVARVRFWPKSSNATAMTTFMDGGRENIAESRCAVTLMFAGYEVVPQVTLYDADGDFIGRVDFVIKGTRVVIEFDGKVKYADDDGTALFAEKKREDRIRSLGYTVVRLTWADLENPAQLIAKVNRALALDAAAATHRISS